MRRKIEKQLIPSWQCDNTTYCRINIWMTIQEGHPLFGLAQSILCKILTALMMMMWWFSRSVEHLSNHLKLIFELIILLLITSQQLHHHAVCDHLGDEEGEDEGDEDINDYGNGDGADI